MPFKRPHIHISKSTIQSQHNENIETLEKRRQRVQYAIHKSLAHLHALSNEKIISPQDQKEFIEEVERLEGIEKDTAHLYDAYKNAKEEARRDLLTGLQNRRAFEEALELKVERAANNEATSLYVLYIDIDNFKKVNDEFGHAAGDDYLRLISHYVMTQLRPDDTLARIGGDEFAAIFFFRNPREESNEPLNHDEEAEAIVSRVYHAVYRAKCALRDKLSLSGENMPEIDSSRDIASIGYVRFDGKQKADDIMKKADATMYEVKKSGASGVKRAL